MTTHTDSLASDAGAVKPQPDDGLEVRRHPRHPLTLRVRYPRRNAFFYEFTTNVSQGGMFVATEHPLEIGRRIRFELDVPGELEPFALVGEVVWRVCLDDAPEGVKVTPGMGIEFVFESAAARASLNARVRRMIASTLGPNIAKQLAPEWPT